MSAQNSGIKRFENSEVFGVPDFLNGITTPTVTSNSAFTLSSPTGFYLGGAVVNQDIVLSTNTVLTTRLPFFCIVYLAGGVSTLTLPPSYPGARILLTNNSGGTATISVTTGNTIIIPPSGTPVTSFTMANGATYLLSEIVDEWLAVRLV